MYLCMHSVGLTKLHLNIFNNAKHYSPHDVGFIKVAEHSFRARFRSRNSARAQGFQKTNMPSIERSLYLLKTRTHCVIFLYN